MSAIAQNCSSGRNVAIGPSKIKPNSEFEAAHLKFWSWNGQGGKRPEIQGGWKMSPRNGGAPQRQSGRKRKIQGCRTKTGPDLRASKTVELRRTPMVFPLCSVQTFDRHFPP